MFRIILQLSRFFIEYSGFETFETPIFRHPSIDGDSDELKSTSMYEEFKSMMMLKKDVEKEKDGDREKEKEREKEKGRFKSEIGEEKEKEKETSEKDLRKSKKGVVDGEEKCRKKLKLELRKILDSRMSLEKLDMI